MPPIDKRRYRRIDFRAEAIIIQNGETISGEVRNVSTQGVFVKTDATASPLAQGDAVVSIRFSNGAASLAVTMPVEIVRTTDEGVALHSPHINIYPILHLEHLFIYRKGNPQQLTVDFCEYICAMPSAGRDAPSE